MFKDICLAIVAIILFCVVLLGTIMGLEWANQKWNCTYYPGDTKMIAGTCYIKENNKYVTLHTYINNVSNVNVQVK